MDVKTMFPSKYVSGSELTKPVNVTISQIKREEGYKPGEGKRNIYVLYCENATRGIVLSRPLAFAIAEALGEPDTTRWEGRQICLYPQPMTVAGRDLIAIRARAVSTPKPSNPTS